MQAINQDFGAFAVAVYNQDFIKFDKDPLACILSMAGSLPSHSIVARMSQKTEDPYLSENITIEYDVNCLCSYYKSKLGSIEVDNEHLLMSNKIRAYYGHKLFINNLKGQPPKSGFRKTLAKIIGQYENFLLDIDDLKILVKLAEFYQQDTFMDALAEEFNTDADSYQNKFGSLSNDHLPFIGKIHIRTRQQKIFRYFFKCQDSRVVALDVEESNSLIPLLNKVIEHDAFVITGELIGDGIRFTNYGFYRLFNWELS